MLINCYSPDQCTRYAAQLVCVCCWHARVALAPCWLYSAVQQQSQVCLFTGVLYLAIHAGSAGLTGKPITTSGKVQLIAFCIFEVCVGIFWPSMMKMRAAYVPEELRSTIINIFRVPLNMFVCIVLYNVSRQGGSRQHLGVLINNFKYESGSIY